MPKFVCRLQAVPLNDCLPVIFSKVNWEPSNESVLSTNINLINRNDVLHLLFNLLMTSLCVGNCSFFARLAFLHWILCALQMCCYVRWAVRAFALNTLPLKGELNFALGLRSTTVCEKTCVLLTKYTQGCNSFKAVSFLLYSSMQFIQGSDRHQTYFTTLDDQISLDNPVRLIDAFIDKLELHHLGFKGTVHKSEGRPPYAPSVL